MPKKGYSYSINMLPLIITSVTTLTNSFLGAFVYFRNPKGSPNRLFALLTISMVGWIVTLFLYYVISEQPFLLFIGRLNFAIAAPMTYFFYRLVSVFPKETIRPSKIIFYVATLLTALIVILSMFTPLIDKEEIAKGAERVVIYGDLWIAWAAVFIANLILGVVILFIKIIKSRGLIRLQLLYLLTGFLLFITIAIATNIILPTFNNFSIQQFGPLATVLFVGFTTYAIVKHRLLNIRLLVARSIAYTLIILIVATLYTLIVFWISNNFFGGTTNPTQAFIYVSLTLFIALTFQTFKEFIKKATDKFFYKSEYNSNILLSQLNNIMSKTLDINELTQKTLLELTGNMKVIKGALFTFRENSTFPPAIIGFANGKIYDYKTLYSLAEINKIIIVQEEDEKDAPAIEILKKQNIALALPLQGKAQSNGILLLGEKKNGELYTEEDIQVLEIFGPAMSVAIENSKAYEEIKQFNKTLQEKVQKATKDLSAANIKLQELDKLKDEFVSTTSHELRTPMTVAQGYIWKVLQEKKELSAKNRENLEIAYGSTERLIALVNDILDVARIESGRMEFDPQKFDAVELSQKVLKELLPKAEEKAITITVKSEKPYFVFADVNKIHQVLINLIYNAVKFTPVKGTIIVSFSLKNNMVLTSVSDTGIGIKKEDQEKLFGKFSRLDSSLSSNNQNPGTGLGLYLSKKIVEYSKGKITLDSQVNKGSTFTFSLPTKN